MTHVEEARKLSKDYADFFCQPECVDAIAAALAAAEERGRREERERCAKAHDVLAGLSSFLGAGLGDESTTAEQYDKRIRWGIDELQSSIIRLCTEKVERCSERPSTTWGEVKASLASILPLAVTKDPTP